MKMHRNPTVMRHTFSEVPRAEIPRSTFDRSHGHKTTFDSAYLVPIYVDEALPGDTFTLNMTGFARLATPIYPVMDNMFMDTQFFAVPVRLVWDNWGEVQRCPDESGRLDVVRRAYVHVACGRLRDRLVAGLHGPADRGSGAGCGYVYACEPAHARV